MPEKIETQAVTDYLLDLQDRICTELEYTDGEAKFVQDDWQ